MVRTITKGHLLGPTGRHLASFWCSAAETWPLEISVSITTRVALLKVAENQMRSRGYSAFSYADLAAKIGIRKASIHHHFPTKERLGQALIKHSISRFQSTLRLIEDADQDPLVRLRAFYCLFSISVSEELLPLLWRAGRRNGWATIMLTRGFLEAQLEWLEKAISEAALKKRVVSLCHLKTTCSCC